MTVIRGRFSVCFYYPSPTAAAAALVSFLCYVSSSNTVTMILRLSVSRSLPPIVDIIIIINLS